MHKIAVFFDAENISYKEVGAVFAILKSKGDVLIKKAYADWGSSRMNKWRPVLVEFGIDAVNYHSIVKKKNCADISLTVDVMDLLHSSCIFDVFALASGDSDYGPLVEKMNETKKRQ